MKSSAQMQTAGRGRRKGVMFVVHNEPDPSYRGHSVWVVADQESGVAVKVVGPHRTAVRVRELLHIGQLASQLLDATRPLS